MGYRIRFGEEYSLPKDTATHFSSDEIKRLARRFKKIDLDNSGTLSIEEILRLPELQQNPLVNRALEIFDTDGNKELDFKEFIEGVSLFSKRGVREDKLKFVFKIYDVNQDGFISNGELFTVLKMMVGDNLQEIQLQQIVDKTMVRYDEDGDGKLSYDEFIKVAGAMKFDRKMVVGV